MSIVESSSGGGIASIIPPWELAYEVDYTAQSSQDFKSGGDGTYQIDGIDYVVANTANCSAFSIGANGIAITPTVGVISHPTYTGPHIRSRLIDLYSDLGVDVAIRAMFHYEFVTFPTTNFEALVVGLVQNDFSIEEITVWNGFATNRIYGWRGSSMKGFQGTEPNLIANSTNVSAIELEAGAGNHYAGEYSGGWPTDESLTKVGGRGDIGTVRSLNLANAECMFFGGEKTGGGGLTEIRLKRFRLDTRSSTDPYTFTDVP